MMENRDTCVDGYEKVYIEMNETVTTGGKVLPLRFKWIDGGNEMAYDIDRILEVKQTYAPHVGGLATRYRVRIGGREKYLWYEGPAWFVEKHTGRREEMHVRE